MKKMKSRFQIVGFYSSFSLSSEQRKATLKERQSVISEGNVYFLIIEVECSIVNWFDMYYIFAGLGHLVYIFCECK